MTLERDPIEPAAATYAAAAAHGAAATDAATESGEEEQSDSGYGWVMFTVFCCAALGITFTVAVLALVGSWWMLGVAVAAHLTVTTVVMRVVINAFGSSTHDEAEERRSASAGRPREAEPVHA